MKARAAASPFVIKKGASPARRSGRRLFVTAAKGLEQLLAEELEALGAKEIQGHIAGVAVSGDLDLAYRVCLWSRLASRVLLEIARFPARDPAELYAGVQGIDWLQHMRPDGTFAVQFTSNSSALSHTQYGAQKTKDAIADQMRTATGRRPNVDLRRPEVRVAVHVQQDEAEVSIDLAGESLHQRGYRRRAGEAPLRESLAAAVLLRARWPEIAAAGGAFVDPMCGSGTLPIEAALLAADIAPGLLRDYFGFLGWKQHHPPIWSALRADAAARREAGLKQLPPIVGYDVDPHIVAVARENAARAGLAEHVLFVETELAFAEPPQGSKAGLVAVNPPYGERLGSMAQLDALYGRLGVQLATRFAGWRAAVLTNSIDLGRALGLRAERKHQLFNGPIEVALLHFDLAQSGDERPALRSDRPQAKMLANRLEKNVRHARRWAEREGITCYRVYDCDLPEYAVAIDLYEGRAHVQEFAAPKEIAPARAREHLRDVLAVVPEALGVPPNEVFLKVRQRQRGAAQYQKRDATGHFFEVHEGGHVFSVNLCDYLDTGLFLDHRQTRAVIQRLAADRHFLNLFAYTGSATVYAAKGGAATTTSVDSSNTYTEWARRNLELNDIRGTEHRILRADCRTWLAEEEERYGLIFLDPPTFSNSNRTERDLDLLRDHVGLIQAAARLLEPDGVLIFSTNARRFELDRHALAELSIEEITATTVPPDFERRKHVHRCWRIERPQPAR